LEVLLILIRNPQLGKVKTRLARTMGDVEALRIYKLLLDRTRRAAQGVLAERWLFYSDFIPTKDDWPESDFQKKIQHPGDCPELSGALLQQAFDALDHSDFVIGPTPDGGYYLLGMKKLESTVFHGIEWSTETVRNRTLDKIRAAGLSCAELPVLSDLDTEEDVPTGMRNEE